MVCPGVKIKPVEGDRLRSHGDFSHKRPHFRVKAVPIHAQIGRSVTHPDKPGQKAGGLFHAITFAQSQKALPLAFLAGSMKKAGPD